MRASILVIFGLIPWAVSARMARGQDDSIPATDPSAWIAANAPRFDCPDSALRDIYYFRRDVDPRQLKQTPDGWVVSKFLPDVPWAKKYNTIKSGTRYNRGGRLRVLADGKRIASADILQKVNGELPPAPGAASPPADTAAGWVKYDRNPLLGGALGTCFDITVLKEAATYRMWFSWRPKKSIAITESDDGMHWSGPQIVLGPSDNGWEEEVNRPVVLKLQGTYHLWYTGQAKGHSWIGHAASTDGKAWVRAAAKPVLSPQAGWEKVAVMCPDVMWDESDGEYRMYYSGGEQYEPDAIGYATSRDGNTWTRNKNNPIFAADPKSVWEQHKVTACQVIKHGDWYYMFYIGFRDVNHAQIGIARSRDGITHWERHPQNPVISPTPQGWDHDAVYKPAAVFDGKRWMLWYNGRHGSIEQIGVAFHDGEDLGFEQLSP